MFKMLNKFFSKRKKERIDYKESLKLATTYFDNNMYEEANKVYSNLYKMAKGKRANANLSVILHNLILTNHKLGKDAKGYFDELLSLRFTQLLKDEEANGINYIQTVIMGVEHNYLPKNKLAEALKILQHYKNSSFYNKFLQKIDALKGREEFTNIPI